MSIDALPAWLVAIRLAVPLRVDAIADMARATRWEP